jgi:voltage-gated potassium channel
MIWSRIAEYLRIYLGMFLNRRVVLFSLLIVSIIFVSSTGGILFFERNTPDGLRQPFDVLWWVTLTLLNINDPGFFPTTVGGKIIGLFLTGFSTVLLWLFSAIVVTVVLDIVLKEGQGMGTSKHKNHIIICGWNETAEEIIGQLHSADPDRHVVVLGELERKPANFTWMDFLRGNPSNSKDLKRANIMEADVAIIFPMTGDDSADAESLLAVLAIETLNRDVYTCVEVLDPKNKQHFERANVDEMFVKGELGAHLLARATLCKGLSQIVSELLRWDEGNEFYKLDLRDYYPNLIGKTFDEAFEHLRRHHKIILLGIERTTEKQAILIDPGEDLSLQKGDQAIVVPCSQMNGKRASTIVSELVQANEGVIAKQHLRELDEYLLEAHSLGEITSALEQNENVALLAVQRMTERRETFVNPNRSLTLREGDQLFVIAWDPPEKER